MPNSKIYLFFGLIASGKSTLGEAWANEIGARYYNSDRLRKELAGQLANSGAKDSFNQGIYTPEFSRKTYDALLEAARHDLQTESAVVLDASYSSQTERDQARELAAQLEADIIFILCRCPEELMKERMEIRAQDPNAVSDGRWEIYLSQKKTFSAPKELDPSQIITINTNAPVKNLLNQLKGILKN